MKKKAWTGLLLITLCLLMLLPAAAAETRQGVIALEGEEETIEETLFESSLGFSFWYANERLNAYVGVRDNIDGTVVEALYSDSYMVLSRIPLQDAVEYMADIENGIEELTAGSRMQLDVYQELENGRYYFLTLIAENGQYLRAVGEYPQEAAEGTAKFLQRVLDSVVFTSDYVSELLKELPYKWAEKNDGAEAALTLEEDGKMALYCSGADGGKAYTCEGTWTLDSAQDANDRLTLRFTSTDDPSQDASAYSVECVYEAYTESWVENDTLITYLILTPVSSSGASPFDAIYGEGAEVALHREQGPNMQVFKCKEYVSLRAKPSTSAKRLVKVPLGALVLAFPEYGEDNGFIYCVYHDQEGYILLEYLQPVE